MSDRVDGVGRHNQMNFASNQAYGKFLGSRDPVSTDGGTLPLLTQPVEYFCVRFQKRHKLFSDSTFEFMRRYSGWTIALAAKTLDRKLRNVIAISSSPPDRE